MSTPTPRTDKMSESLLSKTFLTSYVTMQELARTLERELAHERDQLHADLDAIKSIRDEEKARADEAEHDCRFLICQLNAANAELEGIRALADRRNKRYHVEDTTHQLVAALDQALDIAQAQIAAERAKVRTLRSACERLRDCDWTITLPDRMDAVRDIARAALAATEDTAPKSDQNAPKLNQTGANRPASPHPS